MGGRGGAGGSGVGGSKETTMNNLLAAGGKRWQKGDKDRIYLSNALGKNVDWQSPSRKVREQLRTAVDSAFYDVKTGEFSYKKSSWNDWTNHQVESAFSKIKKSKKK